MPATADFSPQHIDRNKLLAALSDSFSEDELSSLCFELNIAYDHLPPGGVPAKARELLLRYERERRLPELAEAVLQARPHIPRHSLIRDGRTDQSPFKGLPAFEETDANLFFGRDALIAELIAHLHDHYFLAVIGASGSGKSSVVRAGVVPTLKGHRPLPDGATLPEGSHDWHTLVITPTAVPLEELAHALTRDLVTTAEQKTIQAELAADSDSLHLHLRKFLERQGRSHLLLVVDQFEELFTLVRTEQQQRAFVENLLTAVSHPHPTLHLILTLRADFYHHCAQFDALRQALASQQHYIGEMSREDLRQAIELPAQCSGLTFEPGLGELLLRDVGAAEGQSPEPGALPLLSHALLETWRRREGDTLTLAGYTAAGGVHGAIAKTAESTYQHLTPAQQTIARNIFLRLTELGEGTQDTRRRASLDELLPRTANVAEVETVLKLLVDARLVITDEESAEVAHEALIREWPTLRRWLDEDREGLRIHRQLTEDATEWERTARDVNYLYRGGRLAQTREWAATPDAALNELEQAFLDAGFAQQQDELAEAQARYEREAEAAHKLRQRAVFLLGALVIVAVLAIVSFRLFGKSSQNANEAIAAKETAVYNEQLAATSEAEAREQAQISQSQVLAVAAQRIDDDNPMGALLLAIEAGRVNNSPSAFLAINQQLPTKAQPVQAFSGESIISDSSAIWNEAKGQILTWGCNEFSESGCDLGTAVVWDVARGKRLQTLGHKGLVNGATWNEYENQVLTWSGDGTAVVWNTISGERLLTLSHGDWVIGAMWNRDARQILTWSSDGTVVVWDTVSGERLLTLSHGDWVIGAMWSEDESQILTWSYDGAVVVWDAVSSERLLTLSHGDFVIGAMWNEDESQILTWSRNHSGVGGMAIVWDAVSGKRQQTFNHDHDVIGAMWSEDEGQILTWSGDDTAVVWDAASGERLLTLSHGNWVNGATWNEDESQILTWSSDGTAVVWDTVSGERLQTLTLENGVISAMWSEDESQILTWNYDGTGVMWDMTGKERPYALMSESWIIDAMWSEDKSQILTWSGDHMVTLWDMVSGDRQYTIGHDNPVYGVVWNGNESQILTGSDSGTAVVWDAVSGERQQAFAHGSWVYGGAWNGDESRILTWSDRTVVVWDTISKERLYTLSHDSWINGATWNGDGSQILTWTGEPRLGEKGAAVVWEATSGERQKTLNHEQGVNGGTWNEDESQILTWSDDGTAIVWNAVSGERFLTLTHEAGVNGATWKGDESQILTWSDDGTAVVWGAINGKGKSLMALRGDETRVVLAQWSHDDSRILLVTAGGYARLYYTDMTELLEVACRYATRNLNWTEWQLYLPGQPYRQTCPHLPRHPSIPPDG
ncbi:MAG: hypothetical protein KF770_27945 [Anaerolineae bacterium]|nr:hypothetical protein [Anaerolineae bacterium]